MSIIAKADATTIAILFATTFFSVVCVAIILSKIRSYGALSRRNADFLERFNRTANFADIVIAPEGRGILENVCRAGLSEFNRILKSLMNQKMENVSSFYVESQFSIVKDHMEKTVSEEIQKSDQYLVFLAVTGSTSPLLGLLGTVWGITHAFTDIGRMGSASLNVVAPGIAEALITTIWGIAVALPGVIAYNYFNNRNRRFEDEAYNFSAHLLNLIKINLFSLIYKGK